MRTQKVTYQVSGWWVWLLVLVNDLMVVGFWELFKWVLS